MKKTRHFFYYKNYRPVHFFVRKQFNIPSLIIARAPELIIGIF